jgi:CDP-diacylglycerol---glycerol-3-phosphate 3-phosphatidyltransferase
LTTLPGLALLAFLALVVVMLLSMVVYAARGARPDSDAEGKGAHFLGGWGDFVLHWFLWSMAPLVAVSLRLGLTPDFYNYAGLALGLVSGASIAVGQPELGGWAIVLGGVCDVLDGRIARLSGSASDYGDFIDSTFDRFVEAFIFLGFAMYLRANPLGAIPAAAALAASFLVSYSRARGEVLGVLCSGGLMQRGERLLLTCLTCFLDRTICARLGWRLGTLSQAVLVLLAVTSTVTAVHRTIWIARRLRPGAPAGSAGAAVHEGGRGAGAG